MRFLTVLLLTLSTASCGALGPPRNVIVFISDGCGFATFALGRGFSETVGGSRPVFDTMLTGSVTTRSSHQRVTDSAASGTALACGVRTMNGRIATDTTGASIGTVLEAAERAGLWTGLVSTARITHATPAAFSSHVVDRAQEDVIAVQQLDQGIEVLLGGGLDHFLPLGGGGTRGDGRDLLREAVNAGYTVVRDADGLETAAALPLLGLFDATHMDFDIDREEGNEPSLAGMTRKALDLLSGSPHGFFVMIEAGRIDHAGHDKDAAAHVRELKAYEEAMRVALDFARQDGSTLIVATSDHETGGLTLGSDGIYSWSPEALTAVNRSLEVFREHLVPSLSGVADPDTVMDHVVDLAGESGMGPFDEIESIRLSEAVASGMSARRPEQAVAGRVSDVLADMLNKRAGLGWSTTGHTAVDVPLYAFGPGSSLFTGTMDNDEFGRRLARIMDVQPGSVTRELQASTAGE